jgi:predicted DNA-binding transcriptional regulator AlpA
MSRAMNSSYSPSNQNEGELMADSPKRTARKSPARRVVCDDTSPNLPRLYSKAHVLKLLGVTRRTIQRWVIERSFPKAKELGPRTQVYLAEEVDAWIMKRLK